MNSKPKITGHGSQVLHRYGFHGATVGFVLGVVIGASLTAPQVKEMALGTLLWINGACMVGGAAIGYLVGNLFTGLSTAGSGGETDADPDAEPPEA